jgi:hypothetical protein
MVLLAASMWVPGDCLEVGYDFFLSYIQLAVQNDRRSFYMSQSSDK